MAAPLFDGLGRQLDVWNSHGDKLTKLCRKASAPPRTTDNSRFAADRGSAARSLRPAISPGGRAHAARKGDPAELSSTTSAAARWTGRWARSSSRPARASARRWATRQVVLGLSGGVDSSVAAALLHKAIGDQLTCIFVNNGLLRANEAEVVQRVFGENFHIKLKYVDASERFLNEAAAASPTRSRSARSSATNSSTCSRTRRQNCCEERAGRTATADIDSSRRERSTRM